MLDVKCETLCLFCHSGKYGSAWIGLNDIQEPYFYQWNDGSEVTYTNWDVNMPITDPTQEQHCVALNNQVASETDHSQDEQKTNLKQS